MIAFAVVLGALAVCCPCAGADRPPFFFESRDLDKLAQGLRKRVDALPVLKQRIDKGQVALATFRLIGIGSDAVADTVTESLTTSLMNAGFQLVERGQLDKVLGELKIQDTALIDPETAQKIGRMTGCDVIVLGSIADKGDYAEINARIIETATGKGLVAERVEPRKYLIER